MPPTEPLTLKNRPGRVVELSHSRRTRPKFSVVIPVYNSAPHLEELHVRLRSVMGRLGEPYEILFINDASVDASLTVLQRIQASDGGVIVVDLMRNFGQHNAVVCGLSLSEGEYVITMDDDLQHPPEEIPKLIAAMEGGAVDAVIGRYVSKRHSLYRNFASRVMKQVSWYTLGVPTDLKLNSFRLMKRRVADAVVDFAGPRPRIGLIMFQVASRIVNVDVEHHARRDDRSSYRPSRLIASAIDNIINYSALPLRLLAIGGFVTAATAVVLAFVYLLRYELGDVRAMGFTTIVLLLLFFMGLTMCAFGIVGEYLIRIVRAAEHRPSFVVRQTFVSPATGEREAAAPARSASDPRAVELPRN
jgi:polyisoprenyl-phosphate glycosyltransferase